MSLTILMDTREKSGKKNHILRYFDNNSIQVERIKLNVGDYAIKGNESVVVDLKRNILELASNFFCDKVRFEKECIRAKNNGISLIFLIEEKCDKNKLMNWCAPTNVNDERFLNVHGWQIYNEMKRYSKLFNCKFRFCHKNSTGRQIISLLQEEIKKQHLNKNKDFNKSAKKC